MQQFVDGLFISFSPVITSLKRKKSLCSAPDVNIESDLQCQRVLYAFCQLLCTISVGSINAPAWLRRWCSGMSPIRKDIKHAGRKSGRFLFCFGFQRYKSYGKLAKRNQIGYLEFSRAVNSVVQSAILTRWKSLVRIQYRPPLNQSPALFRSFHLHSLPKL